MEKEITYSTFRAVSGHKAEGPGYWEVKAFSTMGLRPCTFIEKGRSKTYLHTL